MNTACFTSHHRPFLQGFKKIRHRKNIDIFHSVIGSDDPVLEPSERADPTKAKALYAKKDATIIDVVDEDLLKTDTLEKKLHEIEKMDEGYYRRIQKMQDGMRTASRKNHDGSAAVVIAFQAGNFRRYYKIDLEKYFRTSRV